jgi:hypothetical protein
VHTQSLVTTIASLLRNAMSTITTTTIDWDHVLAKGELLGGGSFGVVKAVSPSQAVKIPRDDSYEGMSPDSIKEASLISSLNHPNVIASDEIFCRSVEGSPSLCVVTYGKPSDIWSLGCVFAEGITGNYVILDDFPPHTCKINISKYLRSCIKNLEKKERMSPTYAKLVSVIKQMLVINPDGRATARQLLSLPVWKPVRCAKYESRRSHNGSTRRALFGSPKPKRDVLPEDINTRMVTILTEWLSEVCVLFKEGVATYLHALRLLVDFLNGTKDLTRNHLQLAGAACLLIASKVRDLYQIEVNDLLYICDNTYTRGEIICMEQRILGVLNYQVIRKLPYDVIADKELGIILSLPIYPTKGCEKVVCYDTEYAARISDMMGMGTKTRSTKSTIANVNRVMMMMAGRRQAKTIVNCSLLKDEYGCGHSKERLSELYKQMHLE